MTLNDMFPNVFVCFAFSPDYYATAGQVPAVVSCQLQHPKTRQCWHASTTTLHENIESEAALLLSCKPARAARRDKLLAKGTLFCSPHWPTSQACTHRSAASFENPFKLLLVEQQTAVVRRRVAIHGDSIEALIHLPTQQALERLCAQRRVGEHIGEHGRHVGLYHASALGDA